MHNLPLGSAKHVLKTWTEMGILSESDLEREQKRVSLVKPPSEGFKGFTGDQWKNWVCILLLFCFKGSNTQWTLWNVDSICTCLSTALQKSYHQGGVYGS